jgi:hypothetical protein
MGKISGSMRDKVTGRWNHIIPIVTNTLHHILPPEMIKSLDEEMGKRYNMNKAEKK